ncbi:hypothetical protein BDP81DRAFT_395758 [Colletotrichum phormii]|uniref:Uncharacterized protein n=1 Tax=Colletotrichum phormii TaxID=359342 RepID=A0AAI9ZNP6_9PEZI|nr:uncharacterized protein BDP81DRAFT_395758 [Colletotrichum phormii]KAK1635308.1 hypothetical protein BDP81DRAFT_395758 [Colletotrichum phormii]
MEGYDDKKDSEVNRKTQATDLRKSKIETEKLVRTRDELTASHDRFEGELSHVNEPKFQLMSKSTDRTQKLERVQKELERVQGELDEANGGLRQQPQKVEAIQAEAMAINTRWIDFFNEGGDRENWVFFVCGLRRVEVAA